MAFVRVHYKAIVAITWTSLTKDQHITHQPPKIQFIDDILWNKRYFVLFLKSISKKFYKKVPRVH